MYKIINKKKLYATMVADFIGKCIFFPKFLLNRGKIIEPDEVKEILIIRTAYIGDVVMTIPLLKPIRERFPHARITFLTASRAKDVLLNNPYIDDIVTYDPFWFYASPKKDYFTFITELKKKSFDLVIETRADIRELLFLVFPLKAKYKVSYDVGGGGYLLSHVVPYRELGHKVEYHLDIAKYLGCKMDAEADWDIYLRKEEEENVEEILRKSGLKRGDKFVVIHPGARKELKCWDFKGYAAVADFLIEQKGVQVIVTGAPDEAPLVKEMISHMKGQPVNLAGKTTLREVAGIFKKCSLVICNDSSPMHIAAAVKIPTIAIFGPSKSIETAPYGKGHKVVEKEFSCRTSCDEDVCLAPDHNRCMKDITVDDVIEAIEEIPL